MLFSIIVPVFNVEPYLAQCLDSLLPLLKEDCELLLVLGNSSDRSTEIAMQYTVQSPYIFAIEQNGIGLSNARNCGVAATSGKFILYIDSDDYVNTENLRELQEHIQENPNEADVYMTDFHRLYSSGRIERISQIGEQNQPLYGLEHLPAVLSRKKCFWNVWRFIYRRVFLEAHHISFLEDRNSEDLDYTTQVLLYQPRIVFWNVPFYIYRVGRGNSLMDVVSLKRVQDVTTVIEHCIECLDEHSQVSYQKLLQEQYRFEYLLNIALIREVPINDRRAACMAFQNWKRILQPTSSKPVRLFYYLLSMFGLQTCAWILLMIKQKKRALIRSLRCANMPAGSIRGH